MKLVKCAPCPKLTRKAILSFLLHPIEVNLFFIHSFFMQKKPVERKKKSE
jgi:hypothetical protein